MSKEIRAAALSWMRSLGIRDPSNLDMADYGKVRSLLGQDRPAFGIFLSMIMFERQQAVAQLINCNLSSEEGKSSAAKLQGIVSCVDTIHDLVLNIADPIGEGSDSELREVAGVRFNGERTEQ